MATPETFDNYVRLRRGIFDHLFDGRLTWDEFCILLLLIAKANPKDGIEYTSYDALVSDTQCKFSKNHINKIMLSLKRKKYLTYPNHRGRRTSLRVQIDKYPKSGGGYTNIFQSNSDKVGRSENEVQEIVQAEVSAELLGNQQNLDEQKKRLIKGLSMDTPPPVGRTCNNDNKEKEREKETIVDKANWEINPKQYTPTSYEEQKCQEYALQLGETSMKFILSSRYKYGFNRVQHAYNITREALGVENRGAYFNKMIKELGEKDGE